MTDQYNTISESCEGVYKEKGSKFIALAHPVQNENEVKAILETCKKNYHDARHVCYAYRLGSAGEMYRYNDDGEPSGTAGKPIYGQLLSFDVTNVLVVVVRYFGGTKLGVSGLINAYRQATADALSGSNITECVVTEIWRLVFQYPLMNDVMRLIADEGLSITGQNFQMQCTIDVAIRLSEAEKSVKRLHSLFGLTVTKLVQ